MRGLTLLVAVASRWVMTSGSLTVPGAGVGPLPTVLPLYTPPVTGYIGPQPGDNGANVTGTVVVYAGDVCNPGEVSSAAISGRVVFVSADSTATMACLYEQAYMNFVARDVLAVILCYIDEFPSYNIWLHDGTFGSRTRALRPMFLLTGPSANVYEALIGNLPGRNVTIYPDVNVWEAAYAGLSYQLFVRGFPSAILILSGLSAAVFFIVHMRNIAARVTRDTPSNRSVPAARRLRLVASYIALPHVTLFVEMVTATAAGLVLAVGGYYSTPNIEFPVQAFFSTLLGGWGLACSIACAMTWTRKLTEVIGARDVSWITRIIRGDKPIVTALLCTIPIVLDTAVTSNFTHNYCPPILANGYGVISTLFQIVIGVHVIISVCRYHRMVLKVQVGVGELSLRRDANVDKVMQRLSRCALGLSLSMILNCCGSGIIGAAPVYAYTPEGWTLAWTLTYTGRALDSVFRVAMFKPRLRPTSTAATAVVHPGHPGPAAPM